MYAVAFDLVVADPRSITRRCDAGVHPEIGAVLPEHGFRRVQGSLYVTENEDMANLFLPSRRYAPERGSQSRCETFAPSELSSGRTSPPW